jgi:light-regulated signal transduction histidine kinase (bacteriophytochrome)
VLDDEDLHAELAARGHARALSFSWERSVRAIHSEYMRVLGVSVPALSAEQAR